MKSKKILLIFLVCVILFSIYTIQQKNKFNSEIRARYEINEFSNDEKEGKYKRAIDFFGDLKFINSDEFLLSEYIGEKVILLDFWTYSCINCQRTLPYIKEWYQEYEKFGLLVIGVHTPEFDFEKDYQNVNEKVLQYGLKYPVILDNDYNIWNSYGINAWPTKILIDKEGFIVYKSIGEGKYQETESKIQELLKI